MTAAVSFSHIINPFPAPDGSEHAVANRITFASLRRATEHARSAGVDVEVRAVVLRGEEHAIEPPAIAAPRLTRTIQDVRPLRPVRPLPLIADILQKGAGGAAGTHLIFTNMDIALQPHFYTGVRDLIVNRFGDSVPFIVYRRNIDGRFREVGQLAEMYAQEGTVAYGFDCFVFPARYLSELDLGTCCIGSGHFDNLLFMALDAASGFRMGRVRDVPLTFHVGNELEWIQHMDYIEHNLGEALAAISRIRARYDVPAQGVFASMERNHFQPNARIDSVLFRKFKGLPGVGAAVYRMKKWLGRTH